MSNTAITKKSIPVFIKDAKKSICKDCEQCIVSCPTNALFKDSGKSLLIDRSCCILCGFCVDGCPETVLMMDTDQSLLLFERKDSIIPLQR